MEGGEEADGDGEWHFFFDVEVDAVEVIGLEEVAEGVVVFVELLFLSVACLISCVWFSLSPS